MSSDPDRRWLDAAARIAKPWRGTTAENPTVGALVVDPEGVLLGRGVTARGGRPHAETVALAMAGEASRSATLYVTLEPCNHFGRTPPCVDALLAAGLARVVVGIEDPDPRTAGQGIARLRAGGVAVTVLGDHGPSLDLHEGHLSRIRRGRPFVVAKLAVSADGRIGRPDAGNIAVTGEAARRWTHMQRALSDAVMVGATTARLDDPLLTVRLAGLGTRSPLRVVVGGATTLPPTLRMCRDGGPPVWMFRPKGGDPVRGDGGAANVLELDADGAGRVDLGEALALLGQQGIGSVLVEGGAALTESLIAAGLVDRFHLLEGTSEIGPDGVPATPAGDIPTRLAGAGFVEVDRRALGCDSLRTFEKAREA